MHINLHGKPFATYSFRDPEISRPYFANIFAPSGVKITRNHPPAANDPKDHDKMHPGIWLAFGDLSGADSWRLKAPIEHIRFVVEPASADSALTFVVENRYLPAERNREICRENCRYAFHKLPNSVLVIWESTFHSEERDFAFGDQEEMGLGIRLAKPVAVKSGLGGRILNSNGQKNEKQAWGQQADWCDYSGMISNDYVGITLMPYPDNFRKSWYHTRDTGFMAANPFGRNAFTGKAKSTVVVPAGESFHLRYGVLIHWNDGPADFDPAQAYRDFLRRVSRK
jgi:hypothetical protein